MDERVKELIDLLEDEISLCKASLDLSSCERDAMKRYSLEDILECQRGRKSLNLKIAELEESRVEIMGKIAGEKGVPVETLILRDVVSEVDGDAKERLENNRLALKNLLLVLSAVCQDNRRAAHSSLEFIDRSIKVLSGYSAEHSTYLSSGAVKGRDHSGNRMVKEA